MALEEVNRPSTLPSYPEMILRAIEVSNGGNGSNKSTISSYMISTYSNLPAGHSSLLTHHLNMMRASGELLFSQNNYTKRDPNAPPPRGRGRPPKSNVATQTRPPRSNVATPTSSTPMSSTLPSSVSSLPKRRGRPPKDPNAVPKPPQPVQMKVSSGTGKPRGRPRKLIESEPVPMATPTTTTMPLASRRRGRPRKVQAPLAEDNVQQ